jgi:hypothetical protein
MARALAGQHLDDVELLFVEQVGDIERMTAADAARIRAQLVLFRLEVLGKRLAPCGLRLPLRCALRLGLLGRLGALLERPPLLVLDDRRSRGCRRLRRCASLALLALRFGKQLGDALVEASKLLNELSDLLALRSILLSQRFQLVHRPVQMYPFGQPRS